MAWCDDWGLFGNTGNQIINRDFHIDFLLFFVGILSRDKERRRNELNE